jgi:hypothetical protein
MNDSIEACVDELMVIADRLRDMKQAKQCVGRLLNQNQNLMSSVLPAAPLTMPASITFWKR